MKIAIIAIVDTNLVDYLPVPTSNRSGSDVFRNGLLWPILFKQNTNMKNGVKKGPLIFNGNTWPFVLVTSLFFLWGLANNMTDTLLAAFKRIMSMTDFQTSWIQLAFYGSYFFL